MHYIYVKDGIIKDYFCGSIPEAYSDGEIIPIENESLVIAAGEPLSWYDDNFKRKHITDLVSEGLKTLAPDEKIVGNIVEKKTDLEMYKDGSKPIPDGYELFGDALITKRTDAEIIEAKKAAIRSDRTGRIEAIRWRVERYRDELERGSATTDSAATYAAILVYIQALRDVPNQQGFPDNIEWPVAP